MSIHRERNRRRAEHFGHSEPESASETSEVNVDEYHTGGGWYQIGDKKVQGKDAAREALEAG